MARLPRIGLMLDASRPLCEAMLRGIVQYANLSGPWQFCAAKSAGPPALRLLEKVSTGIIVQVDDAAMAEAVSRLRVPALAFCTCTSELTPAARPLPLGEICVDFFAAAELAAKYLLARGLPSFAFVGASGPDSRQSAEAERGFRESIEQAGATVLTYRSAFPNRKRAGASALAQWLMRLPKPVGVMAWSDQRGREVLDACRLAGLAVPVDAAVISVQEDDLLCDLADPPLSGVAMDGEGSGLRAAELLYRLIQGTAAAGTVTASPIGIIERGSTPSADVDDRQVAAALALIRRHATQPIGVEDIVGGLPISRRALELRFRKAVGRGPHAELQRARLMRAQELLLQTDLPIPQVAAAAGYNSGSYLAQVFHRTVAMSPGQYRRAFRGKNSAACG